MKKTRSFFVTFAAAVLLVGCGDPSKEDVCGDCLDANIKATCEAGYDGCVQDAACSLGDYESDVVDSGVCSPPE